MLIARLSVLTSSTLLTVAAVGFSFLPLIGTKSQAEMISAAEGQVQSSITEQEAHAIGVDAYLYFYPLVLMDLTRKQSTNIEADKAVGKGPENAFVNVRA
jgi:hypothetical protein